MMPRPTIVWDDGTYDGDNRRLARCGHAPIGAVFVNPRGRYVRWRAWVTPRMYPVEGAERSEAAARREVERRFLDFLVLAGLLNVEEAR